MTGLSLRIQNTMQCNNVSLQVSVLNELSEFHSISDNPCGHHVIKNQTLSINGKVQCNQKMIQGIILQLLGEEITDLRPQTIKYTMTFILDPIANRKSWHFLDKGWDRVS